MSRSEIESGLERLAAGFMVPSVWEDTMLSVETNCGTETVPDECGDPADYWDDETEEYAPAFVAHVLEYCEGNRVESVERVSGWFARLSAPGYMDCTDMAGPFESESAAEAYLVETYDDGFDDEDSAE